MEGFAYYCERYGKLGDISLPLSDRSVFFGDAVYDAAIGRQGRVLFEGEHINRFTSNAARLGFSEIPEGEELSRIFSELIAFSGFSEYFIYFQLSATKSTRQHSRGGAGASLLVTVTPYTPPSPDKTLKLITYPDKRYGYCDIKTVNLLPAVLASTAAEDAGADEAVFYRGDEVTECAHSNISILKSGTLVTHPTDERILPGITRAHMLVAAERLGIGVEERPFTISELFSADEVIVSSTTKFCLAAEKINDRRVGGSDKKRVKALAAALFEEYFRQDSAKRQEYC